MDKINSLTEYFYYKYPDMINNIKDVIEIDTYVLYIELINGEELTWDSFEDEFVNITNHINLREDIKKYRFRIILIKQMKKRRITKTSLSKRTRNRSIYDSLF